MKIPQSVRNAFAEQKEANDRLKGYVDRLIDGFKEPRWHYESRVKQVESYALKLESGRVREPAALEDFFACTLVVANVEGIDRAEQLVRANFTFVERRPPSVGRTHKAPEAFPFDDLRLYVSWRDVPSAPPTGLAGIVFEVQIKTFLQHAWSIATHDLLYKTADPNWSKARIAYQTKAMLEHAEVSIREAESLATSPALATEDETTAQIKASIAVVQQEWTAVERPDDVRRLAQNVVQLIDGLRIDSARLAAILAHGKAGHSGIHPANLSPFATIVQYLFVYEKDRLLRLLTKDLSNVRRPLRVLIPEEVDIPNDIDRDTLRNAIFVPKRKKQAG